jgi:hypothetical protein
MTTPQIRIIDGDTVTDRDMNAEEITAYEIMQDEVNALAEAQATKAVARQIVLDRLGITAEEAQLLLGGI